ncbi:tetratricopeptide repeat protein 38 isoform X3 [Syngnathoides biaculeatus]|uniref:tetratricopeptide repeat protein 38 isoform X3 n=1 Tax=Syngnathoides biaculeatus TaxID=300417 RepID=UPI002ADD432A|nr:tetratricopeptide repeat protein 38 isoform X3 [Syngnathoides biaculeatus]
MDPLSYRDCEAWRAEGLPLSTSSNEACKLYDAILTQYATWRNIDSIGGIEGCMTAIKAADPDFVMGRVVSTGLELVGTANSPRLDQRLASAVKKTVELANNQNLTSRERLHVKAMEFFSHGYLKGLYSFGLLETRFYDQAEKVAMEGLALVPDDAWSVHALAHVYEMKAELDKGLKFMEGREKEWKVSDMLASHNYWHWALYFIEKGQYEAALQLFDSQIFTRCKAKGSMLDMVDASSLLSRLEMEGVFVKDRYRELLQVTLPHTDDHVTLFNDLHFLMVSVGARETGASQRLLEGLQELAKTPGDNQQHKLAGPIGVPMCQALMEYGEGNYDQTVELLYPLRYNMVQIGGSDAQRDVFNQLLIHAALKSENKHHQRLGRCLLVERDAVRPNSPLTDRLMQRAIALQH